MPVCTKCNETKDSSCFYAKSKARDRSFLQAECKECFCRRMRERQEGKKQTLVEEHGGCCTRCGYDQKRCLCFHHVDPETKEFGIATRPNANIEVLRAEAAKCMLLCPNCHAEKHEGLW